MKSRREASALGVAERDPFRVPAILVIRLGAERGDLKLLPALDHDHHAELASDGDGAFEERSICSGSADVAMS